MSCCFFQFVPVTGFRKATGVLECFNVS